MSARISLVFAALLPFAFAQSALADPPKGPPPGPVGHRTVERKEVVHKDVTVHRNVVVHRPEPVLRRSGPGPGFRNPGIRTGGYGHRWAKGARFYGTRRVFTDYDRYHVRRPPAGYEWVQDDDELALIAVGTGIIADTYYISLN